MSYCDWSAVMFICGSLANLWFSVRFILVRREASKVVQELKLKEYQVKVVLTDLMERKKKSEN